MERSAQVIEKNVSIEMPGLVRLWILRMLVLLGAEKQFVQSYGFSNDRLASCLELDVIRDDRSGAAFDVKAATQALRNAHREGEVVLVNDELPGVLRRNIQRLGALVDLTEVDCRILEFAVLMRTEPILDEVADWLGDLHSSKVVQILAVLLQRPVAEINCSLSAKGALSRAGLLSIDRSGTSQLRRKLTLLASSFPDRIFIDGIEFMELISGVVEPCSAPDLSLAAYEHVSPVLTVLRAYLSRAVSTRRQGVNVLIYGVPGTGKSQLARVLASEVGCSLYEVTSEDDSGSEMSGVERLHAFGAAQAFLAQHSAIVLFDEIEDLFSDGSNDFAKERMAKVSKASMNRILATNRVPSFWISNSIRGIDKAFIRRFDFVFELPVPPRKYREQMIRNACVDLIGVESAGRVADAERLAPAVVTRTASIVRLIGPEPDQDAAAAAFELLVSNTLEAQRHRPLRGHDPSRLPETYDPAFICADAALDEIADGLKSSRMGRLCLYGPPGTGKTAYGRWLAEHLDMTLTVKRASDLMSPYVGQTEINIAEAFHKADRAGELLMIDEVDSFLQDRRHVRHSWEAAQVNELLTQLESFGSVFIASTNLMEGIDPAALRRFDLKVKFDFLRPPQASSLLVRHCASLGLASPLPEARHRVERLRRLTPGDFAVVARQHRFRPLASATELVRALEMESSLKEADQSSIGFVQ